MSAPNIIYPPSGGGGGGGITGGGTTGTIAKFTSGTAVGDSVITENAATGGHIGIVAAPDLAYALNVGGAAQIVGSLVAGATIAGPTISAPVSSDLVLRRNLVDTRLTLGVSAAVFDVKTQVPDGTAALPSYSFTGSDGTGMSRGSSGNILRMSASGAFVFGASTAGNVAVGGAAGTAAADKLTVRDATGNDRIGATVAGTLSTLSLGSSQTGEGARTITFERTTGNLTVSTGNTGSLTPAITMVTSGNVGIGTTSPIGKLQVGPGADTPFVTGQTLYVSDNGSTTIGFRDAANDIEGFNFAGAGLVIFGAATSHPVHFRTNNASRMIISNTTGIVTIGATAGTTSNTLDVSTGGWGVKLPASPGNGDVQTLDCYAEGTWTPVDRSGAGLAITFTHAYYTRIGNMVTATFVATYPATASAASARISLPFNGTGTDAVPINGGCAVIGFNSSTATSLVAQVISNTTQQTHVYFHNPAADVPNSTLSTRTLQVSATYLVV